mmetsp:Transcript_27616/g.45676  ORF Transcript_27616/g.45676 Transcript_27616/m.45676 type:complete len:212 (+) Transcript_27616:1563-2198(+)
MTSWMRTALSLREELRYLSRYSETMRCILRLPSWRLIGAPLPQRISFGDTSEVRTAFLLRASLLSSPPSFSPPATATTAAAAPGRDCPGRQTFLCATDSASSCFASREPPSECPLASSPKCCTALLADSQRATSSLLYSPVFDSPSVSPTASSSTVFSSSTTSLSAFAAILEAGYAVVKRNSNGGPFLPFLPFAASRHFLHQIRANCNKSV